MKITKIYLVTNCFGDPNKVYIGKTIGTRYYNHKNTFGDSIIYAEIDEIESLESKDWIPLESFWIEYFRQLGFNIQNRNSGGGGLSFCTDETKLKMSLANLGKNKNRPINVGTKPILQYNLNNKLLKRWDSVISINKELGYSFGNISNCCRYKSKTYKKSIWRYEDDPLPNDYELKEHKYSKVVLQYDLEGNFIREWKSAKYIENELGIFKSYISLCCRGIKKNIGEYKFKYKK